MLNRFQIQIKIRNNTRLEAELGNGEAIQNAEAVAMWVVLQWLSRCVCVYAQACACILLLTSSSGTSGDQNGSILARPVMVFVTQDSGHIQRECFFKKVIRSI